MNRKTVWMVVLSVVVWCGLGSAATEEKSAAVVKVTDAVSATMKQVKKTFAPPETAGKDVIPAEIEIRYPELSAKSGEHPVVDQVNKAVMSRLLAGHGEEPAASMDELMTRFGSDYAVFVKENPDVPGGWSFKYEVTIRHANEDFIALDTLCSTFLGGAHPNSEITYQVFSMKTGKPLVLPDLFAADKMGELHAVAEKHFRQLRGLKTDESLEEAGFQFENNRFALNENFLLAPEGLAFCFNAYEVAPYAMGPSEFVIPWADLKGVALPDGPAARFLKK